MILRKIVLYRLLKENNYYKFEKTFAFIESITKKNPKMLNKILLQSRLFESELMETARKYYKDILFELLRQDDLKNFQVWTYYISNLEVEIRDP